MKRFLTLLGLLIIGAMAFTVPTSAQNPPYGAIRCGILTTASTNSTLCSAAPATVVGYRVVNTTTTIYYLRMYNRRSAPTCSSATGFIESIPIPPASAAGGAGGIVSIEAFGEAGYTDGIGYCLTASATSTANDNAAAGIYGAIFFSTRS